MVVTGVEFPAGIAFSPDGSMYFTERGGRVRVVRDGVLREEPVAAIGTTTEGETGLLGIEERDGILYVFATDPDGTSNSVLAVRADGEVDTIVGGLPASVYHNGGGVAFDDDGMLLVSNGDGHDSGAAQDPDALGGKIYRFTPEGSAAPGNPFGDAIALGLRNPFGLTVDPVTGDAFVTDNGPSSDDEINRISEGGNYGWPDVLGSAGGARPSGPGVYRDPVSVQEEIVVPTGIAVADPATARPTVAGDLFYGTYGEQAIHRVVLDEARREAVSDEVLMREKEPVIALEWGPRGLYYSTPTSIKVIPLAAPANEHRDEDRTPRPGLTIVGPPLAPDPGFDVPWLLLAAAVAALALGVVLLRFRR